MPYSPEEELSVRRTPCDSSGRAGQRLSRQRIAHGVVVESGRGGRGLSDTVFVERCFEYGGRAIVFFRTSKRLVELNVEGAGCSGSGCCFRRLATLLIVALLIKGSIRVRHV